MTDKKAGKDYIGIGAGAIILRSNKVLLLLRTRPPEVGTWSLPGGKVDFNETIEDALIREVKEELDVDAKIVAPLGITNHILPDEGVHWIAPRFLVEITGEPTNVEPDKHAEMKWFNIDDLPKNLNMTGTKALEALKEWLKDHPFS